ncbi:2-amino-4-hydroxy-6-hydroxymethyldihydropteridine diphosphokinase [Lentibacter algarum]|uniref:2-amino-4-hydroxy-6- hydroxymethyldihydropteridine diphosphokinase n=1 Tax=Lentibacter algarum TaxID=576131 RepID=UPI001C07C727|nr:2-amino-4-hydroxy-6-hydroxymethyldihydropteridine diphosphokinase [Lentibacter algarum]MBU2981744.1 2-amino-4-hydroxy-6-hydroxymethyldihydropteridine diphosphokinase [Lentibacter algarum]
MNTRQQIHFIALGANLPFGKAKPQQVLHLALEALAESGMEIVAKSRFYATPCFPAGAGPDYVNAAAVLQSDMGPEAMLEKLHSVETQFGRERLQRWGTRSLDLDLLATGESVLPDEATFKSWLDLSLDAQKTVAPEGLVLPHPRMHERAFVLVPLAEIAPDWRHPVLNRSVLQMLADLPAREKQAVKAL